MVVGILIKVVSKVVIDQLQILFNYNTTSKQQNNTCTCDVTMCHQIRYKWNIWQTLYLANEGKNRIGERLNWQLIL